jgi:hypothetical protein
VEGSCEHGNKPSGSAKCWEVPELLHNSDFLKRGSAPRENDTGYIYGFLGRVGINYQPSRYRGCLYLRKDCISQSHSSTNDCLSVLNIVPHGLISIFIITLSRPLLNNIVNRESPYLIPHSLLKLLHKFLGPRFIVYL